MTIQSNSGRARGSLFGLPRANRNLKEYVKEQDVVGTWNLQPESIALVVRDGFKTNRHISTISSFSKTLLVHFGQWSMSFRK